MRPVSVELYFMRKWDNNTLTSFVVQDEGTHKPQRKSENDGAILTSAWKIGEIILYISQMKTI